MTDSTTPCADTYTLAHATARLDSARLSHAQHGTCTHERDKSPDREVRSCLLSNVRVRRALLPFLLRSLYASVVVVYLSVDVALHGAHCVSLLCLA